MRVFPAEAAGTPLPDSKAERPPLIRRAEVVAFALVSLLLICVVAVLYVAKAFFLPIVAAFVVGTMLSPAAGFLERRRIPRAVSAVLIVTAVGAAVAFIIGLISSPLMDGEYDRLVPDYEEYRNRSIPRGETEAAAEVARVA